MALVLQDRVKETSTSTGTGTITLGGAVIGYRSFASCIPTGSIVYYTIHNTAPGYDGEWEVGYGTYTLSSNTLSRDNVYSSSNANTLVAFSVGANLEVFITYPAEQAVYQEVNGDVKLIQGAMTISEDGTLGTTLPNTAYQAFTTGNYYMQSNMQNLDSGAQASGDWVATADNGTDTEFYVDMGMASSGYNYPGYDAIRPNTGYLISTGSDLRLIAGKYGANVAGANAAATDIVFVAGDLLNGGQRGRIKGLTGNFILSNTTNPTDNGQKLQVVGNAAISSDLTTNLVYSSGNISAGANGTVLTTKTYVDSAVATGFTVHTPCVYATTADLGSVTYSNGTLGVGATLTNAGTQAALVIDGHTFTATDVTNGVRVLVKNESNAAYNGAYVITDQGSGSTNWVLTRATDFDQAAAGEIANNAYFYVTAGSTNIGTSWVLSQTAAITVGSTALPFTNFASQVTYTGGQNIQVSGQTISLTGIVPIANGGTNLSSYTTGDILYSTGTNILGKRAIGTSDQVLLVNGGVPTWGAVALGSANGVSGTLPESHGGTNITTYTLGDIIYSNATNTLAKLPGQITTTQKFLSQTGDGAASAAPSWSTVPVASITGLAPSATTDTSNASNITSGTLPTGRISGSYTGLTGVGTLTAGTWNANVIGATYGGTGVAGTITGIPYANGISAYTAATAAQVVSLIGTTAVANATYAVSAGSATTATTATNIAGGAAGSIPYQSAAGTTQLLATASGVLVGGLTPSYSTAPTLTGTNFSSIPNSALTNSAVTINSTSIALGGSGTVNLANNITFNNGGLGNASGVTFNGSSAPTISYNTVGAAPTAGSTNITSVGTLTAGTWNANVISTTYTSAKVTDCSAGTGITLSATTGSVGISIGQAVATSSNVQFNSLGVGTAGSAVAGEIRATNNITAYYVSDRQFKENIQDIPNALDIAVAIGSKTFDWTDAYIEAHGGEDGYFVQKSDFGVIAQDVQAVFPKAVRTKPDGSLAVDYEKLGTLAFAALGQLLKRIEALEAK